LILRPLRCRRPGAFGGNGRFSKRHDLRIEVGAPPRQQILGLGDAPARRQ